MRRIAVAIFMIALVTLMLELTLTRVFDVVLTPNLGYMVISCALFGFGLAGIYSVLRPIDNAVELRQYLATVATLFAIAAALVIPTLNLLPFNYEELFVDPLVQLGSFGAMYLAIGLPFFLSGLIFAAVFSRYAESIQRLYFWDLAGAGLGCVILVPFLPHIGPGGLIVSSAGLAMAAAALLATRRSWSLGAGSFGAALLVIPWLLPATALEFRAHIDKRGVKTAQELGIVEFSRWDPISKIEIIPRRDARVKTKRGTIPVEVKHVAYDGGNQSSNFYRFDGNLARLRQALDSAVPGTVRSQFWQRGVLASHYLKRDREQQVLIFGSAGGQETKAALAYGAGRVDAVELVGTVVELGKGPYASFIGNIFNDPRVRVQVGEGRSYLRASSGRYDIIQIFSNHNSSSIAAGTGAMNPTFLQTAEAYREYFDHLKPDGVLHVNHHVYPRMITTAALAWRQMGRTDFQRHVAVFARVDRPDRLPLLLIKMSPWTAPEIQSLRDFLSVDRVGDPPELLVENPLDPRRSFLSPAFYSGELPESLVALVPYRVTAATDDRPFFNMLRKYVAPLDPDPKHFTDVGTAEVLNTQLRKGRVPMDLVHLAVTAIVSLIFTVLFVFLPLRRSRVGKERYAGKASSMLYFSSLGAGFIILELVFIQVFMQLIGYPLYTYSAVIFSMLAAAALGSLASARLRVTPDYRWSWPFIGVLVSGGLLLLVHPLVFQLFLAWPTPVRVLVAVAMIFPLGFFLGMPFPLGILVVERHPKGAVAWAWGMNGLFTVVGGLLSVVLALAVGFRVTIGLALLIYAGAFALFGRMRGSYRRGEPEGDRLAESGIERLPADQPV